MYWKENLLKPKGEINLCKSEGDQKFFSENFLSQTSHLQPKN